jgi:hypothetical protein
MCNTKTKSAKDQEEIYDIFNYIVTFKSKSMVLNGEPGGQEFKFSYY